MGGIFAFSFFFLYSPLYVSLYLSCLSPSLFLSLSNRRKTFELRRLERTLQERTRRTGAQGGKRKPHYCVMKLLMQTHHSFITEASRATTESVEILRNTVREVTAIRYESAVLSSYIFHELVSSLSLTHSSISFSPRSQRRPPSLPPSGLLFVFSRRLHPGQVNLFKTIS